MDKLTSEPETVNPLTTVAEISGEGGGEEEEEEKEVVHDNVEIVTP